MMLKYQKLYRPLALFLPSFIPVTSCAFQSAGSNTDHLPVKRSSLFIETSPLGLQSTQNRGKGQDCRQSIWELVSSYKLYFMNGHLCHLYGKPTLMNILNSWFTEVEDDLLNFKKLISWDFFLIILQTIWSVEVLHVLLY